jgi:FMN phosphatase YigB (HAD superfamily)
MPIRLVTLDCANTLLRGSWEPVEFALWAAREAGLCLPSRAGAAYADLLRRRYPAILAANRTGDYAVVQAEYVRLGEEWLLGLGVDPSLASSVVEASETLLTSIKSGLFEPFEDTVPFLLEARARELRLAVVSNWDASLPMVLKAHGIDALVDEAFASLVVGAEKPDPTMIHLAMESASVKPSETLHIGDDPVDDLGAADNAGVQGLLIDRKSSGHRDGRTISSLQEAFQWIG